MLSQPRMDLVRQFVIAGHGNLVKVKEMLDADPTLLNESYPWSDKDSETAIQAAAQVGSSSVAEFLLSRGAPLHICTAAMLGRSKQVQSMLKGDPSLSGATGAHGIPLLSHAALSGNPELVELVWGHGATTGATLGLVNAVSRGYPQVVRWLLENTEADANAKNFEGKTCLVIAGGRGDKESEELLKSHGATG